LTIHLVVAQAARPYGTFARQQNLLTRSCFHEKQADLRSHIVDGLSAIGAVVPRSMLLCFLHADSTEGSRVASKL
jgi:hypothetical protein